MSNEIWHRFRCMHCENGWVEVLDPPLIEKVLNERGEVRIRTTRKLRQLCDCAKNKDKS